MLIPGHVHQSPVVHRAKGIAIADLTFASWLLQNGADLSAVQDMLGHASPNMTRRYAHLEKAKTAKRMGEILSVVAKGPVNTRQPHPDADEFAMFNPGSGNGPG